MDSTGRPPRQHTSAQPGRRRPWFVLGAVLLGLAPLAVIELGLAAVGLGDPAQQVDRYAGFGGVHRSIFVPSGASLVTSPAVLPWFEFQEFPAAKPQGEFRIFCVGGSTVQGRPYGVATAFSSWLEILLQAMEPTRRYRVVNVGGISYASYRLLPVVDELFDYEPDLVVVYAGHNEFLEDRTYQDVRESTLGASLHAFASRFRSYNLLEQRLLPTSWRRRAKTTPAIGPEVEEILNQVVGLEAYERDPAWHREVFAHYRHNIRAVVDRARDADVPLLLVDPVENLDDCRPFKSAPRLGLSPAQRSRFDRLLGEARAMVERSPSEAGRLLRQARDIDDGFAEVHFWLGKVHQRLGDTEAAYAAFRQAKELDVCPLRMLEPMHAALAEIARETGTPILDARRVFTESFGTRLFGGRAFVDHVHPTIGGHQRLAEALADRIVRRGWVVPRLDWVPEARVSLYEAHLERLGSEYFLNGRLVLAQVLAWAHRYDDAEAQLRAVLDEQPTAAAYLQLGQVLARQGRVEEAAHTWTAGLTLDRTYLPDLLSLALYESQAGGYRAASVALESYLDHDPPPLRRIEARFGLAVLADLQGDRATAVRLYQDLDVSAAQLEEVVDRARGMGWFGRYAELIVEFDRLAATAQ